MGSVSGSVGDVRRLGGGTSGGCVSVVVWGGAANLRRNLRFCSVTRPEPDTLIQYWSYCFTSVTIPVLSHRGQSGFGCGHGLLFVTAEVLECAETIWRARLFLWLPWWSP